MRRLSLLDLCVIARAGTGSGGISMLEAFIDESFGNHSPILIVGGGITTDLDWLQLERYWKTRLKKFGINKFRASDCANFLNEFAKWETTPNKRDKFYRELTAIMGDHLMSIAASGIDVNLFNKVCAEFDKKLPTECGYCVETCSFEIGRFGVENDTSVHIFIDKGQKLRSDMLEHWKEASNNLEVAEIFGVGGITRINSWDRVSSQIGDFIAYELFHYNTEKASGALVNLRSSLVAVLNKVAARGHFRNEAGIRDWLQSSMTLKEINRYNRNIRRNRGISDR